MPYSKALRKIMLATGGTLLDNADTVSQDISDVKNSLSSLSDLELRSLDEAVDIEMRQRGLSDSA